MKSFITVGLGYGDEGKGTVVDGLVRARQAKLVIRYNGGAQAAHNVVLDDGRHHTFHQFGSGSFVPGVKTFLSKHVLVNPLVMVTEALQLERLGVMNPMRMMHIDERALITTPYHRAVNRLREYSRRDACHGSCGMGIGETVMDSIRRPNYALRAGDLLDADRLTDRLWRCRNEMLAQSKQLPLDGAYEQPLVEKELSTFDYPFDELARRYVKFAEQAFILDRFQVFEHLISPLAEQDGAAVFEGAQGVLLDETCGFHPYTTWAATTSANAREVIAEFKMGGESVEIGIMRPYTTRHGPGPLVTAHQGLAQLLGPQDHNRTNDWQKDFRYGWLDLVALKYALRVNGPVDCLAVTHVDELSHLDHWLACKGYYGVKLKKHDDLMEHEKQTGILMKMNSYETEYFSSDDVLNVIENALDTPIALTSHGPKSRDKQFREVALELH